VRPRAEWKITPQRWHGRGVTKVQQIRSRRNFRRNEHMSVAEIIDQPRPKLPAAWSEAPLPITYTDAKAALERCERVDECAEWADRSGELASYARQARDRELEAMAKRIRARAVRRAGELLQQIPTCRGCRFDLRPDHSAVGARTQAARRAGMSVSQQKTAVRLAKIPADEFEAAVEAADPPGTMRLAGRAALRPPPLNTDADGGFERARGLLSALLVVYRRSPPLVRQRVRDMVLRSFSDVDAGHNQLAPMLPRRPVAGAA
jgi:hypothetical protein